MAVEVPALVLADVGVRPGAQPPARSERILVFAPAPHGQAEARLRRGGVVEGEGQAAELRVEEDGALARGGVEVAVRGYAPRRTMPPSAAGRA